MMAINQTRTTFFTPPLTDGKRRQITVRRNPRTLAYDADVSVMELKPTEKDWTWALDWLRGKGFSEDEVAEFGRGLRVYHADNKDHRREQDQPAPFPGRPTRGGEPLPLTGDSALQRLDRMLMQPNATNASIKQLDAILREPERKQRDSLARLNRHLGKIGIV